MKYAYQNGPRPLLSWAGVRPPAGSRAAETRALGETDSLHVTLPGAPEYIVVGDSGQPSDMTTLIVTVGLAYLGWRYWTKNYKITKR